jgi:hypothetical protein
MLQNAIDLDLDVVRLSLEKARESYFATAKAFYTLGGFSGSYADLQIEDYPGIASFIPAGTKVVGTSRAGESVDGMIMDDLEVGVTNIRVLYLPSNTQSKWSSCQSRGPSPYRLPENKRMPSVRRYPCF